MFRFIRLMSIIAIVGAQGVLSCGSFIENHHFDHPSGEDTIAHVELAQSIDISDHSQSDCCEDAKNDYSLRKNNHSNFTSKIFQQTFTVPTNLGNNFFRQAEPVFDKNRYKIIQKSIFSNIQMLC